MKPILIYKGDDTIFADLRRFLTFNIETNLDLTGWKAKFTLGWVTKEINDISSKSFEIILSSEETKNLRLGSQSGSIVLTDSIGHIKTITNSIPFEVTTQVVENEYQEIDLTIPESSGVDIKLKVGAEVVTSVNGMTGDVYLDIPSIEGLATEQQLQQGLNTKQDKGDYATNSRVNEVEGLIPDISNLATKEELQDGLDTKQNKGNYALQSEIPTKVSSSTNDANYQTYTDVASMIASIPQFKLSIVDSLPETGEKMTLYLVSKGGESPDVYDEYIWIEQTSSFEHLGSTAVDLSDYYTKTEADVLLADKQPKMAIVTTQNTYNDVKTFLEEGRTVYFNYSGRLLICDSIPTATIFTFQSAYHGTNMYWALCGLRADGTTSWQSGSAIVALKSELPTTTSQLTNDSGFVTQESLLEKTTETWTFTLEDGTEVTKTMVLGA